jgi:hypothetical protein
MKHTVFAAATIAAVISSPGSASASADEITCGGVNMSFMTTMIGAMADSPSKWQLYRHLATINEAMAIDGKRGCDAAMMDITRGQRHR